MIKQSPPSRNPILFPLSLKQNNLHEGKMNESEAKKYSFKSLRHPKEVEVELFKKVI